MDNTDRGPEEGLQLLAELGIEPPARRARGRPAADLWIEYARDLAEPDMAALELPRKTVPKSLMRIRSSHHALARCLAAGMRPMQASLVTGYSPATVGHLQTDPAFSALVADYQSDAKAIFADITERMSNLSLDAIEELQERLHTAPEEFTTNMLLELVKSFADRTGHGPNQNINVNMSMDLIDRPPRETYDDWLARRNKELDLRATEIKKLN